jgi:hypothetical protein
MSISLVLHQLHALRRAGTIGNTLIATVVGLVLLPLGLEASLPFLAVGLGLATSCAVTYFERRRDLAGGDAERR